MVAIIETGGKQYCVMPGQKLEVERLNTTVGESVTFANLLGGTSVTAEVLKHMNGDKVVVRKFRNKTRSHKAHGHRQSLTLVQIKGDVVKAEKKAAKDSAPEATETKES